MGKQVFEGAPRQMRTELWKSSLQRRGAGVAASQDYERLLTCQVEGRGGIGWRVGLWVAACGW